VLRNYEEGMIEPRERFATKSVLPGLMAPGVAPRRLERFLIEYCARGVAITRPVPGWIRRAGERAGGELGRRLVAHAAHEEGHHEDFIADTHWLVRRRPDLDARSLLARPPGRGAERYIRLHEDVIAGEAPFAQIAIEYEIERLSVEYGRPFIGHCAGVLGREILAGLSFLHKHAELDEGHTAFNAQQLGRFLDDHPGELPALAAAGTAALEAYAGFLDDCDAAAGADA
jgi:hypothetical protein